MGAVMSLTKLERNNISCEAFKLAVHAVGALTSQQLLIVCSHTKIFESSFTEFLGLVLPRTGTIKTL